MKCSSTRLIHAKFEKFIPSSANPLFQHDVAFFVRQIVTCISDSSRVFLEADQNLKQLADCSRTKRKIGNKPIKSGFRCDLNV